MRRRIIILSIVFFVLSGYIKFKESDISATPTGPLNDTTEIMSGDASPELEKITREQAANQRQVKELQAMVANLEDRLSNQKEEPEIMSKDASPELEKITREQAANQLQVKELQAMVANLEDRLSNQKVEPQEHIEPRESKDAERVLAVLGGGSFLSGQIVISEDLMSTVNRIVPDILASPDHRLIIEGHTDNIPIRSSGGGGYKDNVELAFLRGKAVAGILVKNEIPLERIFVVSFGDTRPIASNETAEGRAKNRRVEIKLVP